MKVLTTLVESKKKPKEKRLEKSQRQLTHTHKKNHSPAHRHKQAHRSKLKAALPASLPAFAADNVKILRPRTFSSVQFATRSRSHVFPAVKLPLDFLFDFRYCRWAQNCRQHFLQCRRKSKFFRLKTVFVKIIVKVLKTD